MAEKCVPEHIKAELVTCNGPQLDSRQGKKSDVKSGRVYYKGETDGALLIIFVSEKKIIKY